MAHYTESRSAAEAQPAATFATVRQHSPETEMEDDCPVGNARTRGPLDLKPAAPCAPGLTRERDTCRGGGVDVDTPQTPSRNPQTPNPQTPKPQTLSPKPESPPKP